MRNTNVKLSLEELRLVTDAEIILTKNRIIEKVQHLFGQLSDEIRVEIEDLLPGEVAAIAPKIYKGEQYQKLPYVLMDYPRYFKKDEVFAVRHFFWWGNFFSITWHVSGRFIDLALNAAKEGFLKGWLLYKGTDEWNHSLTETEELITEGDVEMLRNKAFIKLSKKIPLEEWDHANDFFIQSYNEIVNALRYQLPKR